jgi:hypothetical protein
MTLHPADAKIVLERGWGERHPLARGGWCSRFVPVGFVMIYAPRSDDELRVVMETVRASVWWVSGRRLSYIVDSDGDKHVEEKVDSNAAPAIHIKELAESRVGCATCNPFS